MSDHRAFAQQTCVVTGANRGIGLALTRALLAQGAQVFAGVRRPKQATELQELATRGSGALVVLALDVNEDASVQAFADALPAGAVDLLINNAGVNLDGNSEVGTVAGQVMLDTFNSNTVGPLRVTQKLLDRLHQSKRAKVANISSIMGSIGENEQGGVVAYRASKAALNMVTKCLALADGKVVFVAMHPGWVQTRMGGTQAPVEPPASAEGLLTQIAAATAKQSGTFVRFDGKAAPW